jgi:dihydropteroate synthase
VSFDIYGNNLRRGYCEVHPHVAEEYPCSICTSHSNRQQEDNQRQDIEQQLSYCESHIIELKQHIAELEQIVLSVGHIGIDFGYGVYEIDQATIDKARQLTNKGGAE